MALIRLTPRQLEAFVGVADAAGFGEAAGRLGLTPSAVSQLVAELEGSIGFRLFDRTTRRVALSAAGSELLGAARQALAGLDKLERSAQELRSRSVGLVRIAAPLALAATVLPDLIHEYMADNPRVTIHVIDAPVERLVDAIGQSDTDLALGPDRQAPDDIGRRQVMDSAWLLWCGHDHPLAGQAEVTWHELRAHPLVATGRDHECSVILMGRDAPEEQRIVPTQVVEHLTTALGLSSRGRLATLAPAYVEPLARSFGLIGVPVVEPVAYRRICLYRPLRRALAPATEAFSDFVAGRLGQGFTGSTALT